MRVDRLLRDAWPLIALAAAIAVLLAAVAGTTRERIADNEQRRTRQMLAVMMGLPEGADSLAGITFGERLPPRFTICVEHDGDRRTYDFMLDSTIGYGGRIRYLVSIVDGERVGGVHIIGHSETPGLGDAIEPQKSDWLRQFVDRHPERDDTRWALTMDGGSFDALAGATITSRAMVRGLAASAATVSDDPGACDHVIRSNDG
jgi:Na+-translocating ferredoxin:NAD+ oxidoreductase subunit G